MMNAEKFAVFSESQGIPLVEIGVHSNAFTKSDALLAIKLLQNTDMAILGGDVYARVGSVIRPTYDNWHCDPNPGESKSSYLLRSWKAASEFIENHAESFDSEPLFDLVISRTL